jgi:hypothetical protein
MRLPSPDDIPRWLLEEHHEELPEPLAATVHDPLAFGQALGALSHYSLAAVTDEAISVHRLVQTVVRHALDADQATAWAAAAVALVAAAFPGQAEDVGAWPAAGRLLPHALATTDQPSTLGADPNASAVLAHEVGRYLWGRGEHAQAKTLHERALAIREARLGDDHPDAVRSRENLAAVVAELDTQR